MTGWYMHFSKTWWGESSFWAHTSPLNEMMRSYKWLPLVSKMRKEYIYKYILKIFHVQFNN